MSVDTLTTYTCDRCAATTTTRDESIIGWYISETRRWGATRNLDNRLGPRVRHLCATCAAGLEAFFAAGKFIR